MNEEGKSKMIWSLLPWSELRAVVRVFMNGAKKYSPHGWKTVPNASEEYYNAAQRHLSAIAEGELIDPDDGELHAAHLCADALILAYHHGRGKQDER